MADKEKPKKVKRPTALKRLLQSKRRQLLNRMFKARVRTALREAAEQIETNDKAACQASVASIYSLMDKGVKRGVFKINKANRIKASFALKLERKAA